MIDGVMAVVRRDDDDDEGDRGRCSDFGCFGGNFGCLDALFACGEGWCVSR